MTQIFDLTTLNGSNGFRISSANWGISNAGDMNGDGFDDIVVGGKRGASLYDPSYVIFGKNTPFSATFDPSTLNGNNGFQLIRDVYGANRTTTAGDFNGDGFDDLLVAETTYSDSASIFFGKGTGFSSTESLSTAVQDKNTSISIVGLGSNDNNTISVSSAGDINGDHIDDIILGYEGDGFYQAGSSYVIFGKSSFASHTIKLDAGTLNGTNGFWLQGIDGINGKDNLGSSFSGAGDVNGDGYDDLIVGAREGGNNPTNGGSSYVVFGKASGFNAKLEMNLLDGTNGFRLDGVSAFDFAGHSVSNAGDVNGDGFADILIGAPGTDINGDNSGSSYVVFGKASGFGAVVDLGSLNGSNGFAINGLDGNDQLGKSVSNAGDVNGDGFDDLMVHDLFIDPTSYIIFGRGDFSNLENIIEGTQIGDVLVGTKAAEHFKSGLGNDTINGKGGADIYDAGSGNDLIRISDLNFKLVDGGSGDKDTLAVAAVDANLDLANFSGKITGIERIYLYGQSGSDSGVTLNATQLKALSDTTNKLIVNGNQGDYVHITDDGWQDKGIYNGMHTYANADAQLLVGVNVMVEFV